MRGRVPGHLCPSFTPRACSFANQRLLWCIGGSNSAWCEFENRHGSCLLTKRGSEQHRYRPKWTKISNMSSVQHADPGVPNNPFQGLSEDTPHIPPFRTCRGQKQGNNDDDHRKPTELAQNVPSPRDMQPALRHLFTVAQQLNTCDGRCQRHLMMPTCVLVHVSPPGGFAAHKKNCPKCRPYYRRRLEASVQGPHTPSGPGNSPNVTVRGSGHPSATRGAAVMRLPSQRQHPLPNPGGAHAVARCLVLMPSNGGRRCKCPPLLACVGEGSNREMQMDVVRHLR